MLREVVVEGEVREGGGEVVDGVVELKARFEVVEGRRKVVDGAVVAGVEGEVDDGGGEGVHLQVAPPVIGDGEVSNSRRDIYFSLNLNK